MDFDFHWVNNVYAMVAFICLQCAWIVRELIHEKRKTGSKNGFPNDFLKIIPSAKAKVEPDTIANNDLTTSEVNKLTLSVDSSSSEKKRFHLFHLASYSDITYIMSEVSRLNIQLYASTVLYKNSYTGDIIFYLSYKGMRILPSVAESSLLEG